MPKKLYLTIILLIIVAVATVAAVIALQPHEPQTQADLSSLKPGDYFTYSITGVAELIDPNATVPQNFLEVNMTDYYKVTITDVNSTVVSFDTTWRFTNGTQFDNSGYVNLNNGTSKEFWAIYAANLTTGKPVRPAVPDGAVVNETETRTYKDGTRQTNILSMQGTFYDTSDLTYSRAYMDYSDVHFDSQTGMLVELSDRKIYNDPQLILTVDYNLVDSNVLQVS